jgi:hypothetical protein
VAVTRRRRLTVGAAVVIGFAAGALIWYRTTRAGRQ